MVNYAVTLPAQPMDPLVVLPQQPAFPPTAADRLAAENYYEDVLVSMRRGTAVGCTPEDRLRAIDYRTTIRYQAAAAAHPQAFRLLDEQIVQEAMTECKNSTRREVRSLFIASDHQKGDGQVHHLTAVPFHDGTWPADTNLPPILTSGDVDIMGEADVNAYLVGRTGVVMADMNLQERREVLKKLVGARPGLA